ncbi:MAG: M3 family metallopeptidase, partial [Luteimonas sp.]
MDNPLLDFSGLPRFDEIEPAHVQPAIDALVTEAEAALALAGRAQPVGWDSVVVPLEDATERLGRAWNQVGHLNAVVNTPAMREAYNAALPKVTKFFSAMGQDQALFARYQALSDQADALGLDALQRRVLAHALRDFRLGGAALDDDDRARFAQIQQDLARTSAEFSEHVLDATDAFALYVEDADALDGLPEDTLAAARAAAERDGRAGWKLTLQMPSYLPVQTYATNRELRERLYRAYGLRASESGPEALDNGPLISRILRLRNEQAALLGHANYAELSLATKMATAPDAVLSFLRDLAARARPHAEEDREQLAAFAREQLDIPSLEPWDMSFASDRLRQARYDYSAQTVKRY